MENAQNQEKLKEELELAKKWRDSAFEDYYNAVQKVNHVSMQLAESNRTANNGRTAPRGLENRKPVEKIQQVAGGPEPKTKTAFIAPDGRVSQ